MLPIFTWLLVFTRASAFLIVLPLFSTPNVPVRVRVALAGFLAMVLAPLINNPVDPAQLHLWDLLLLMIKEAGLGLVLGFVCRMVFYAVQIAGHLISTEIGLQTSTLITPIDSVPVDIPAAVLNLLALMLFLTLDMHHVLLIAFRQSYTVLPIASGGMSNALLEDYTLRTAKIFLLAVQIAAPMIAVGFLVGIVLMMLGRAVPQMNIFFESFTIRLMAGLTVFGFSISLAAQHIADYLRRIPQDILEVARILGGG